VVDGLQASEHAPALQSLEMIFANIQHSGTQVEFVEELRDKNMHFEDVGDVFSLHVPQHVDEPLKVPVRRTNPQEVDLFACHSRVSVCGCSENEVVED